jgi:threonine aldolase
VNDAFVSDACAGAHPAVLDALVQADALGPVLPGGDDPLTRRVCERIARLFGDDAQAIVVFTGTAANVLALAGTVRPYEAVICADTAHIHQDECGAPEQSLGVKLLTAPAVDGKLTKESVDPLLGRIGVTRAVQPRVVSISQATELGTTYTAGELRALADHVHSLGLLLHVDGARLANAAAWCRCGLQEAAAGADVVSLGFTKNGALGAEAVVYLGGCAPPGLGHRHKQAMQVAGKMRFLAAQIDALLDDDLWYRNAADANALARRLAERIEAVPAAAVTRPVEANSVFFTLPADLRRAVECDYRLLLWDEAAGEIRVTCSWDTRERDVDALADAIAAVAVA